MPYLTAILSIIIAAPLYAGQGEVFVRGSTQATEKEVIVKTKEYEIVKGKWYAFPTGSKTSYRVTITKDDKRIIVKETSLCSIEGVEKEIVSTTFIPYYKTPYELKLTTSNINLSIYTKPPIESIEPSEKK